MRITKRSFSTVVFPPRYSLRKRGSALGLSKTFEKIPTTKVRLIFEASKFRRSIHCTVHPIANALLIRQNARHDRKVAKIRKITNRNRIAPARRGSLPIVRIRLPNRSEIPVPACETVNPTDRRTAGCGVRFRKFYIIFVKQP